MTWRKHPACGRRSLINLRDGQAVSGVVTRVTREVLLVEGATLHLPSQPDPVTAQGTVLVDRGNIAWIELGK